MVRVSAVHRQVSVRNRQHTCSYLSMGLVTCPIADTLALFAPEYRDTNKFLCCDTSNRLGSIVIQFFHVLKT